MWPSEHCGHMYNMATCAIWPSVQCGHGSMQIHTSVAAALLAAAAACSRLFFVKFLLAYAHGFACECASVGRVSASASVQAACQARPAKCKCNVFIRTRSGHEKTGRTRYAGRYSTQTLSHMLVRARRVCIFRKICSLQGSPADMCSEMCLHTVSVNMPLTCV